MKTCKGSEKLQVNTLVRHKKLKTAGIGCIAKMLSKTVIVNWGTDDVTVCKPSELTIVDTGKCKTITVHEWQSRILCDDSKLNDVIVGNEIKHYVGIGWVTHGVVTEDDLKKYPRVVQ